MGIVSVRSRGMDGQDPTGSVGREAGATVEEPVKGRAGQGIIPLDFESHAVRMLYINGEPWWIAPDVCRILGHKGVGDVLRRLDDDERGVMNIEGANQHGSTPPVPTGIVNEAGLYNLILTSRKPEAKRFKRWLTHKVLPSIRRNGSYSIFSESDRVRKIMRRNRCVEEMRDYNPSPPRNPG